MRKKWMLPYVLVTAEAFLCCFATQMVAAGIPLYCISIGKTTAQAGILAGFYSAALFLARPFSGRIADTAGRWKSTMIGLALLLAAAIGRVVLPVFFLFILWQTLEGLSFSLASTAQSAMALDILPAEKQERLLGYFSVIRSLAYSLGAAGAVMVAERFGIGQLFGWVLGILALSAILHLLVQTREQPRAVSVQHQGLKSYVERDALPASLVQMIFTFALTLVTSYLPAYAASIGILGVGAYFTVNAAVMFLVRMLFSGWIEKMGERKACAVGILLAFLSTAGILLTRDVRVITLLAIPNAIGIGFVNPTLNVTATVGAKADRRGAASATYFAALDLGSGGGGTIWGLLIPLIGYPMAFSAASVLLVIDLGLGMLILRKRSNI